jgi:hypothetical protein
LVGTKRIDGRVTASQIAAASFASFLLRFTYPTTSAASIVAWPRRTSDNGLSSSTCKSMRSIGKFILLGARKLQLRYTELLDSSLRGHEGSPPAYSKPKRLIRAEFEPKGLRRC